METTQALSELVDKSPFTSEHALVTEFNNWRDMQLTGKMNMFMYPSFAGLSRAEAVFIMENYDELNRVI